MHAVLLSQSRPDTRITLLKLLSAGVTSSLCCFWKHQSSSGKNLRHTYIQSVNNGERWFHLLSSQSIAFFPTVGNSTWNMLRHASIYRVTRSCKINQRSSVCQQKATTEKKHMSPFKRKICLFTATKDWKQILSSNMELCQITGSQKKALAWKKLWWVLSYWETAEMGDCFGAGGKGRQ